MRFVAAATCAVTISAIVTIWRFCRAVKLRNKFERKNTRYDKGLKVTFKSGEKETTAESEVCRRQRGKGDEKIIK